MFVSHSLRGKSVHVPIRHVLVISADLNPVDAQITANPPCPIEGRIVQRGPVRLLPGRTLVFCFEEFALPGGTIGVISPVVDVAIQDTIYAK